MRIQYGSSIQDVRSCRWSRAHSEAAEQQLESALHGLVPWRRSIQGSVIDLDTEWRSDLKWDRLQAKIDLADHRVLDVGSGSGYHLWRMLEAGAREVLGIDPSILFHYQFAVVKSILGHDAIASDTWRI